MKTASPDVPVLVMGVVAMAKHERERCERLIADACRLRARAARLRDELDASYHTVLDTTARSLDVCTCPAGQSRSPV